MVQRGSKYQATSSVVLENETYSPVISIGAHYKTRKVATLYDKSSLHRFTTKN